uniref:Uncharacterized protein n=1 Tax=Glossina austeni TaxID=7395 RepID=A0A1A9VNB7_GLOAU
MSATKAVNSGCRDKFEDKMATIADSITFGQLIVQEPYIQLRCLGKMFKIHSKNGKFTNIVVYHLDIAIDEKDLEQHVKSLKAVLQKLQTSALKLNKKKCSYN